MSFLDIIDLKFTHAGSPTPYQFDLQLEQGEILALGGRSGTGKTTLLDLLAGFLQPAAGKIMLDGTNIMPLLPSKRKISYLFQHNNLFEHLSAMDNICIALSPNARPTPLHMKKGADMLEKLEMGAFAHRICSSLSGGQKQRIALARELLRPSKLILLDEPFTGLDDNTRDLILPLLAQTLEDSARAIIIVTHDLQSLATISDHTGQISQYRYRPSASQRKVAKTK